MAEGFLKSFGNDIEVHSAGTSPASSVHHRSIAVMKEVRIDISNQFPKSVDDFLKQDFDYVITVCDSAKVSCPVFSGNVKHRLHIGFEDPSNVFGTDEEVMAAFRKTRDEIGEEFEELYKKMR